MDEAILYAQDGAVVTITLNRPEKRNPISEREMVDALVAAARRLNADRSVHAAIVTGAGSAFSSGGDVRAMAEALEARAARPVLTPDYYKSGIQRIPLAFDALEVPIIAAVNGPAIGAGLDLACMCDIRIAAMSARFAESFVKIGLTPGDGGGWLLPRIVGWAKACELAFVGEAIDAEQALACGLVSRVVADERLLAEAKELAARIARNPPHAVRLAKRLMMRGREETLAQHLEAAAAVQALAHATDEHRDAVRAYLEERAARHGRG